MVMIKISSMARASTHLVIYIYILEVRELRTLS